MSNIRFYDVQLNKLLNVSTLTEAEVVFEAVNRYQNEVQGVNSGMDGRINIGQSYYSIYRQTVLLGQNVSGDVSYTSSRVNFIGWYYDREGTVLYSTSEAITFQALEGGVRLYAIFDSDTIDEEWCYSQDSVSYLCNQCDRTTVYFDKSDLLDVGYAAVTWYSNLALSAYAPAGYYTSPNKSVDTPIFQIDGSGKATIVDYCDGDQISCDDDAANNGQGSTANLDVIITSVTTSTGTTNFSFSGASPGGKVRINASSTFEGNWSGAYDSACLSLYLRAPITGTVADDDTDTLNTVQTFHTFFTLSTEIEITANSGGAGSFKVVNVGQNFDTPSGTSQSLGSTCGLTVTDVSSGQTKQINTSMMLITSNTGNCTGGMPA